MRKLLFAVLALPLIAAAPPKGTIALGIGAASSSEVVVKIAGKNTTVKLAGVNNGTYAGQAFLQCLVASRIVRVDRTAGRVTMLDGSSVADHVAEFLQTKTTSDPCALGKAAYVPQMPALASSVNVAPPANATATPATGKRQGHVSFATGTLTPDAVAVPSSTSSQPSSQRLAPPPPPRPAPTGDQPMYRTAPTVGTYTPGTMSTYTPTQAGTTNVQSTGTTNVPTSGTYTPPQATTTNIPTTSTNPP